MKVNDGCLHCKGDGYQNIMLMMECPYCSGKGYQDEDDMCKIEEDRGYGIVFH